MTHDIVREAVGRLEAGAQAPASGAIDSGLADIGFEMVLPHGDTNLYQRGYRTWGPYKPGGLTTHPDMQTATQAATVRAGNWHLKTGLSYLGGVWGDERRQQVRDAQAAINRVLPVARDRAALDLAQRFRLHTRAPFAGDWVSGQNSWRLVSTLLADAIGYAVGTSLAQVGDELPPERAARVASGLMLLKHAGVWAFRVNEDGRVDAVPEPTVTLNLADEPHSDGAPAVEWPDAQQVWAYNGQIVPRAWILEPERITRERFERTNSLPMTEVMLDIYGVERYVQESGETMTEDDVGKLWHADHPWQSSASWGAMPVNLRVVEVLNSTPEPDGSIRTYWLRVPGTTRRPREGVAWTFALREHDYMPSVET